ncbi:hypothetical protein E4L95_19525 [Paracoccus liaowanqingii]|uniref:Uncharacterized protein n=1 Tax=Paracoccus liaowanqingii TaxID=2560053 RepID=A0A4Z1C7H8_9RHOB|nr:hypothetical protein [Paracoccus liaowanqingii]TGN46386.1 hypothetical protein E4L95_19525 [Paracoccus liaowanqingii]
MFTTRIMKGMAFLAVVCSGITPATARKTTITLPPSAPFPESLTASETGVLYTGSMTHGGIARATPGSSEAEIWLQPGVFDTRSIFGVLADDARELLWVCSNDASVWALKGRTMFQGSLSKVST